MTALPATSKEPAMTTLTSLIRPVPANRVTSRLPALRSLVVLCLSAIIAASFVFDVVGGSPAQPRTQVVQALLLT